jgi:hypothetical protein
MRSKVPFGEKLDPKDPRFATLTAPIRFMGDPIEADVLWIRSFDAGVYLMATDGRCGWAYIRSPLPPVDGAVPDRDVRIFAILAAAQCGGRHASTPAPSIDTRQPNAQTGH